MFIFYLLFYFGIASSDKKRNHNKTREVHIKINKIKVKVEMPQEDPLKMDGMHYYSSSAP